MNLQRLSLHFIIIPNNYDQLGSFSDQTHHGQGCRVETTFFFFLTMATFWKEISPLFKSLAWHKSLNQQAGAIKTKLINDVKHYCYSNQEKKFSYNIFNQYVISVYNHELIKTLRRPKIAKSHLLKQSFYRNRRETPDWGFKGWQQLHETPRSSEAWRSLLLLPQVSPQLYKDYQYL